MNDLIEHTVYIGIGSNLENPANQVRQAIVRLGQCKDLTIHAESDLYLSAPVNARGENFVNAVLCLGTALSPEELLKRLLHLEGESGRQRPYPNAPRVLDLDILLYGSMQIKTDALTIPHPRLTERAFVLLPLLQIAPDIVIPGSGAAADYLEGVRHQSITRLE